MVTLDITPARLDINAAQGKTWTIQITVRNSDQTLVDLTGWSARWQVRVAPYYEQTLLDLTIGQGITLTALGVITLTVTATQTAILIAGHYVHELELTRPDTTKPPFLAGNLTVTPEVVR